MKVGQYVQAPWSQRLGGKTTVTGATPEIVLVGFFSSWTSLDIKVEDW